MTTPTSSRSSSEKVSSDKAYTIGGYDEDRFVSPVADHFKCSICLDVLRYLLCVIICDIHLNMTDTLQQLARRRVEHFKKVYPIM